MPWISDTTRCIRRQLARTVVTPPGELSLNRLTKELAVDDGVRRHLLRELGVEVLGVHSVELDNG